MSNLVLRCNNCDKQLKLMGKNGPNYHVHCPNCGLDSSSLVVNSINKVVEKSVDKNYIAVVKRQHRGQSKRSPYNSVIPK